MSLLSPARLRLLAVWAIALFGTLQIHRASGLMGHAICGPWGCGPPLAALVGYHAFWLVLILPVAMIAGRRLSGRTVHVLGKTLVAIGLVGAVVLLAVDGVQFWQSSGKPQYLLQRGLFRLVTFVDIPLMQLGLAGWLLRRTGRCGNRAEDSADEAIAV